MALKQILLLLGLTTALGFGISTYEGETYDDKDSVIVATIMQLFDRVHFEPKPIDDDFSKAIFKEYFENFDPSKRYLTKEDIEDLKKYEYRIDDELKASQLDFFDAVYDKMRLVLERAENIYREEIEQEINFDNPEEYELNADKRGFPENVEELRENWKKEIKYHVLNRYYTSLERREEKLENDPDAEVKSPDELKEKAVEKTCEMLDRYWDRLNRQRRQDFFDTYLNTISTYMDPHTVYYKPKSKEDFDMRMSNRLEGIGAQLTIDGNYTKVVSLVPGGPAWKGKLLKENDLILKVAQGNKEAVSVMGMHIDDVVSKIRGRKGTVVVLTVKHVDESVEEIEIRRDVIEFEEGYAKSLILHDSTMAKNYGYIYLPGFYTDFGRSGGRKSSVDVNKELKKMMENSCDGMILDLRNNGGGSLQEVVDMAGLFLEGGPIVQVVTKQKKTHTLKDENKFATYKGPLVLLTNHFSASSSEIMAAAMQDYGRAVILGSSSTFGKGTVQRFFNLDDAIRGNKDIKPLGQIKMTIQKYYRVNGGSVQLKGVIPDIIIPDRYNYIDVGEKEKDFAMNWSSIKPIPDVRQNVFQYNMDEIVDRSAQRIENDNMFQLIEESAKYMQELKEESVIPLSFGEYSDYMDVQDKKKEEYDFDFDHLSNIAVENVPTDLEDIQQDSTDLAKNEDFIDNVSRDIYINEAINILGDIITDDLGYHAD